MKEINTNKTAQWGFGTNDTGTIWADQTLTLTSNETAVVIVENNFTVAGLYLVVAKANSSVTQYTAVLNSTVS